MPTALSKEALTRCHALLVQEMSKRGLKHRLAKDDLDELLAPKGEKSFFIPIAQRDSAEQKVWGVVLVPDVPDEDGHLVDAAEIEKVAHRFMANRIMDAEHSGQFPDLQVVESFIVRSAGYRMNGEEVPVGAWVLGAHVKSPAHWERVLSGDYVGFSIKAFARIDEED